jgi:hypothetical protein
LANDTQLFLLLPILAKLHTKSRKIAWAVVITLIVAATATRGVLTHEYTLTSCLGASDMSGSDQARGQTVLYNKPFVTLTLLLRFSFVSLAERIVAGAKQVFMLAALALGIRAPLHISSE